MVFAGAHRQIHYARITTVLRIWLRYENTRICHNSRNFCSIDNRCGDKRGALCKNLSIPLQSMLWYRHWLCLLWFFCGFFFNWSYVNFKGDILFNYSNKDKLTEFFTDNFYGTRACCLVFPLPFAFAINYLLYDEKVFYICRIKNRMQYITQCVLNIIAFSFICAFFHEAVSIICSYRLFGGELINELHIIKYCSLNFITIFLYFVRVGGVFLLIRLFTNKKIAAVYFICRLRF